MIAIDMPIPEECGDCPLKTYRTPKKPETKNYRYSGMFIPACPTCGEFLEDEDYCPKCGQAIEWGEYDGES